ncbi:hypothetical protein [Micromonospora sp. ALFpr18c]|nr:hypothetical protein [Micromonospora sp. ALFpr18c]
MIRSQLIVREEGPDPLRFPDLYSPAAPEDDRDEDDDLEPLDLPERGAVH